MKLCELQFAVYIKTEIQLITSFDVSWAGDELIKLLLGKESEGEGEIIETESLRCRIPAEGIWLRVEAVVNVADQEGSFSLAQEVLKVTHHCREGFVT